MLTSWLLTLPMMTAQARVDYVPEVRSLAAICKATQDPAYHPDRRVVPVRRSAEAAWIDTLYRLGGGTPFVTGCNRELVYGLLPRPWNDRLLARIRSYLYTPRSAEALELLVFARAMQALPAHAFSPDEMLLMVFFDRDLGRYIAGEVATLPAGPLLDRITEAMGALARGDGYVMPRARQLTCGGRLSVTSESR